MPHRFTPSPQSARSLLYKLVASPLQQSSGVPATDPSVLSSAMSRHFFLTLLVCLFSLVLSASSLGHVIVEDNFSNAIFLPSMGANSDSHLGFSISQPAVNLSPYILTVHSFTPSTTFHVNDAFGQAALASTSAALGTVQGPVAGVGSYVYELDIPSNGRLLFNMSYSTGAQHVQVVISASNTHGRV